MISFRKLMAYNRHVIRVRVEDPAGLLAKTQPCTSPCERVDIYRYLERPQVSIPNWKTRRRMSLYDFPRHYDVVFSFTISIYADGAGQ